jgi:UDP-N-acetylglucosamine--N-acetylmuramyl-(pentapeptide) pyrophosphoryl-undecaprenol N-acetylglucosamine transferase
MRIVLTGGGTGGHLFPLIAVKNKIREKIGPEAEFLYIGSGAEMEKNVMSQEGIPTKFVLSGKMRRYFSVENFTDIFRTPIGFLQSLWILFRFMPDAIFSKGGYVAVPVVLAAWIYRIPILIHESDSIPGTANQFLANFSSRIAVAYPSAIEYFAREKVALTGNPVRFQITQGDPIMMRTQLGFTSSKKTLLILGGSQGSQVMNEAIVRILPQLLRIFQIIHQTGEKNFDEVVSEAAQQGIKSGRDGYFVTPFLNANQLRDSFALSDLVISRAGANSVAEIAANGKPSILIPLEGSANNHQRMNAYELAKIGAAVVLDESNLGQHMFLEKIEKVFSDENLRGQMAAQIKTFYHPNAADTIANGVIELARK